MSGPLQIEINKRLYVNEVTLERTAGFAVLQKNLSVLLGENKSQL